jgi:hypothetical protein
VPEEIQLSQKALIEGNSKMPANDFDCVHQTI